MITRHRAGSIFWLLFGVFIMIGACRLKIGTLRQPGPSFIFVLCAALLIILSAIDFLMTFREHGKRIMEREETPLWSQIRWRRMLLILGVLFLYNFVFQFLGFLPSSFLLMLFLYKSVEPVKWHISVLAATLTIATVYSIFILWLEVPFPKGIIGGF